jgi:hypothetical protein
VVAITAIARVEEMIMTTLRMILTNGAAKENDNLFYDAVALTYDISPMVCEYFHNDRSRTRHHNKRLWPLRYQAFKEYRI